MKIINNSASPKLTTLTSDEITLLNYFRAASDEGKAYILPVAGSLARFYSASVPPKLVVIIGGKS